MSEKPNRESILLRLYVAGGSPASALARRQLDELLAEIDIETYVVEVIDVLEDPARADEDRVLATPTLVRANPEPRRSVIGDLGDAAMVTVMLGLGGGDRQGE